MFKQFRMNSILIFCTMGIFTVTVAVGMLLCTSAACSTTETIDPGCPYYQTKQAVERKLTATDPALTGMMLPSCKNV